jgi:hypothetical protein
VAETVQKVGADVIDVVGFSAVDPGSEPPPLGAFFAKIQARTRCAGAARAAAPVGRTRPRHGELVVMQVLLRHDAL